MSSLNIDCLTRPNYCTVLSVLYCTVPDHPGELRHVAVVSGDQVQAHSGQPGPGTGPENTVGADGGFWEGQLNGSSDI